MLARVKNKFKKYILLRKLVRKPIGLIVHHTLEIKYSRNVNFGDHNIIGTNVTIGGLASIKIGSYFRVSKGVIIETAGLDFKGHNDKTGHYQHIGKEIRIGNNVWVGANAIILGGAQIGDNVIIGAGAVVSGKVDKKTIVVSAKNREFKYENA